MKQQLQQKNEVIKRIESAHKSTLTQKDADHKAILAQNNELLKQKDSAYKTALTQKEELLK